MMNFMDLVLCFIKLIIDHFGRSGAAVPAKNGVKMSDFKNVPSEKLAILHGCVLKEIEAISEQRIKMHDGQIIALTYIYTGKLERLRDELKAEMDLQAGI